MYYKIYNYSIYINDLAHIKAPLLRYREDLDNDAF